MTLFSAFPSVLEIPDSESSAKAESANAFNVTEQLVGQQVSVTFSSLCFF